jgi:2-dehydro-3-deoxyphosphogluconate aldolase/(4S)-4-hydroxy-2-oxoglutarate aldolase
MNLHDVLARVRVVPVLTIEDVDLSVDLSRSLAAGGLNVLEITLRTPAALAAVDAISAALPEAVVGVGTVTRPDEFRRAIDAGARFAVSPGLTEDLARAGKAAGIAYMPAAQTASEVMRARELGFHTLKFFPAKSAGGVTALKALAPVFPDVAFCPTGGLGAADFMEYLRLDNVVAVGGSWMLPPDLVKARDWRAIETLARQIAAGLRAETV